MSKQEAARAAAAPALAIDPASGNEYTPCKIATPGGPCMRFVGHKIGGGKGDHRPTLAKPLSPEDQAKRDAWRAMTPEQKEAEFARRSEVSAAKKAAAKHGKAASKRAGSKRVAAALKATGQVLVDGKPVSKASPKAREVGDAPVVRNPRVKAADLQAQA